MRSDATSEARVRGEAPAALLPEGALSPNNCGEHARGNARPPAFPRLFPNALALPLKEGAWTGTDDFRIIANL